MMRIMVFDVPASSGGALSILEEFYYEVKTHSTKDIKWIFILNKPYLEETENIKILSFPWIKKSWFHRYYFDQIISPILIKKYKVDKVFSLQNTSIPRVSTKQILYVHQPLPFIDYKFKFKENKIFWIYQNIIGKKILKSIKVADKVIVQTKWMKESIIKKTGIQEKKIHVIQPVIKNEIKEQFKPIDEYFTTLFYPSSALYYKNHRIIVEALSMLNNKSRKSFKVIFTISGDENLHIKELYNKVKIEGLPIEFVGPLKKDTVFEYYKKTTLIFPSYIETFGLPLLESRLHKGPIIAADTKFAKEILNGYPNVSYFDAFNTKTLVDLLEKKEFLKYENLKDEQQLVNNLKITDELLN